MKFTKKPQNGAKKCVFGINRHNMSMQCLQTYQAYYLSFYYSIGVDRSAMACLVIDWK